MDLAEWSRTSELEQRHRILRWAADRATVFLYEKLAWKAARGLLELVNGIPGVTAVEPDGGETLSSYPSVSAVELILNVYTLLPESNHLPQIPERFAGFRVKQVNLGDKRESYLRTWKRLFKELKGWDEETTHAWVQQWMDGLEGRGFSRVYHDGPAKTAVRSLVDESVKAAVGSKLQYLYNDIVNLIEGGEDNITPRIIHPDAVENYNWDQVRTRIGELIAVYTRKKA